MMPTHDEESVAPVQARRVLEVHAEEAGDQRGDDEDRAPRRELLRRLVQAVRHDGQLDVAEPGEDVALRLDQLVDALEVVVDVAELQERGVADAGSSCRRSAAVTSRSGTT